MIWHGVGLLEFTRESAWRQNYHHHHHHHQRVVYFVGCSSYDGANVL
jgi:hypothetical protein